jgi:predicted metalloprotease with PDZ domain
MPVRLHPHVRLAIALAFAAASTLYSLVWIAHVRSSRGAPVLLGIEYEPDIASKQLRITAVHAGSPAASAGLHADDVLLAVKRYTGCHARVISGGAQRPGAGRED